MGDLSNTIDIQGVTRGRGKQTVKLHPLIDARLQLTHIFITSEKYFLQRTISENHEKCALQFPRPKGD